MVTETKQIWLNKPQKLSRLIQAKEEYGVWGRATGKTDEPIAHRSSLGANVMPRGTTGIVAETYAQLLDRTLPPLFKAWEKFGYQRGKHYWVRERPDKRFKIDDPIYKALDPQHYIYWWNGHVFYMISQDRSGLANAKSLDAVVADEVKFLNFDQYSEEVAPANRGNDELFGHFAEHHMVTMYTDMPTKNSGKWILEKANLVDHDMVAQVISIQIEYYKMVQEYNHPRTTKPRKIYLARKITNYYIALNELRRGSGGDDDPGLVWYSEASTLENIQILGVKKINQWMRELKQHVFDQSILNLKNIGTPDGFFHMLDAEYHGYTSYDYNHIDSLGLYLPNGLIKDCRKDGDLVKGKALDIAMDYNAAIKSLVVGQDKQKFYATLNSMFVLGDEGKVLTDMVDEFSLYYEYHKHSCNVVNYYYDHTAMGTDSTRLETLADVVCSRLVLKGWSVNRHYIGQQPEHDVRYRLWEEVFAEKDPKFKPARFNRDNCEQLLISMNQTGVYKIGNKHKKVKTTERKGSKVRPQDAPHLGDAWETLYIGRFRTEYGYEDPLLDMVTS
ncbi:hypothetical protein BDE36_1778 [Arcticibacter tournemirensis]|uniref:Uncharacterized protein n=1 Tax=Arcticibacter tournemirensis TaxID=699437 RepID=A0A5M9HEN8_9SPHI|nr:hypothetical protein [Arcticibacter tournemirensis]KAA8483758.1 hypothetical protein F1649_07670 [Arcticibacter tournemirensis]TQM50043.1 hypothetical protein BDE36_1778 [Arcticibacter tournemirensis]